MSRYLLGVIACVLMAGCALQRERVIDHNLYTGVTRHEVLNGCVLLGEVQIEEPTGWFDSAGSAHAFDNAETKARTTMGATDVVWKESDIGVGNVNARGQAYRCP